MNRIAWLVSGGVFALFLVACGGDDDAPADAAPRPIDARPPADAAAPVDAGPTVDAAPNPDAAPSIDAAVPDATPSIDAVVPDATPSIDAAVPDAAPPDAMPPDAAPPDAMPPDAGGLATTLTDEDFPAIGPCPSQALLTDATMLATLRTALLDGTLVYDDIPFVNEPSIYPRKCGLEPVWDPDDATADVPWANPPTLGELLAIGNSGICSDGFANFGVDEGFPIAGTYRKQWRVTHAATTYHLRARVEVSGTSAGNRFSDESIAVPGDITDTLVYEVNGTVTAHGSVWDAIVNELTTVDGRLPVVRFDVRKASDGPVVWTARMGLICAATL